MSSSFCHICGKFVPCTISWYNDEVGHNLLLKAAQIEHDQEYHPLYYAEQMGII